LTFERAASSEPAEGRSAEWWLAGLLLLGCGLHFLGSNVADPDLWGHLRYGDMILDGHGLPREEVFSYSAPGAPFYDHEWLADLVTAALYRLGGSAALVVFKLLLSAAMIALLIDAARSVGRLVWSSEKLRPLTVALVLIPVLAVIHPGASFRPQLFTMLFLALEGALLARADVRMTCDGGDASGSPKRSRIGWELAVLPPLLLVWANLHGGFLVGLGIFGLFGGVVALRAWLPRLLSRSAETVGAERTDTIGTRDVVMVGGIVVLAILAPLVNPYGVELYTYLGATLDMHDEITEWYPVTLLSTAFFRFKLLVAASAIAAAGLWWWRGSLASVSRALDWRVPALAVAALYAFRHQRHTVLFAEVAAPLLLVAAEEARRAVLARWPGLDGRSPAVWRACAAGFAAVALFQIGSFADQVRRDGLEIRFGRLDYPIDAVEFLRTHGLGGNVAFPFEWGAYAIRELAPEARVFIDGRFEAVYPERVIRDYFAFTSGREGWERLLDDYPTEVVVVQRWRNIHPRLFARPDLEYVYSDPAALVFVRRTPANAEALDRLARLPDRNVFARRDTFLP
jgi:hypothetical protein